MMPNQPFHATPSQLRARVPSARVNAGFGRHEAAYRAYRTDLVTPPTLVGEGHLVAIMIPSEKANDYIQFAPTRRASAPTRQF